MANLEGKFRGAILGVAVGDALGAAYEGASYKSTMGLLPKSIFQTALIYGEGKLRYTDDTLMTIALAKSILEAEEFNPELTMQKYYEWYMTGDLRGIGITTNKALHNYHLTKDWKNSGVLSQWSAGNGTAMRVSPLALYHLDSPLDELYRDLRRDAILTHRNELSITGSLVVALTIRLAINEEEKFNFIPKILEILESFGLKNEVYQKLVDIDELIYSRPGDARDVALEIGNSGFIVESVGVALYQFIVRNTFEDTVYYTILCGGDTDTNASIAGAIAGAYYSDKAIPKKYLSRLENLDELVALANGLHQLYINNKKAEEPQ